METKSFLILHNARCRKSREALTLLNDKNCQIEIRDYLKNPLSKTELKLFLKQLGIKANQLVRSKEEIYTTLFLDKTPTESQLVSAMVKFPILIERPIVVTEGKAVVGRPPNLILELLK